MTGMVSRDPGDPRAALYLLGGFIAGVLIAQFKKWGGFFGYGIDGHRAGTYDIASGRGLLRK